MRRKKYSSTIRNIENTYALSRFIVVALQRKNNVIETTNIENDNDKEKTIMIHVFTARKYAIIKTNQQEFNADVIKLQRQKED